LEQFSTSQFQKQILACQNYAAFSVLILEPKKISRRKFPAKYFPPKISRQIFPAKYFPPNIKMTKKILSTNQKSQIRTKIAKTLKNRKNALKLQKRSKIAKTHKNCSKNSQKLKKNSIDQIDLGGKKGRGNFFLFFRAHAETFYKHIHKKEKKNFFFCFRKSPTPPRTILSPTRAKFHKFASHKNTNLTDSKQEKI
jgi:hypothetical protein